MTLAAKEYFENELKIVEKEANTLNNWNTDSHSPIGKYVSSIVGTKISADDGSEGRDGLYKISTTGFYSDKPIPLDPRF